MASRCQFENSNDVGVFSTLTNSYAIIALGAAENFYRRAAHAWSRRGLGVVIGSRGGCWDAAERPPKVSQTCGSSDLPPASHGLRPLTRRPLPSAPPCSVFEAELADHIPVIKTSVAGTRLVGRMSVGNRNGLLLPNTTTDQGGWTVGFSVEEAAVLALAHSRGAKVHARLIFPLSQFFPP